MADHSVPRCAATFARRVIGADGANGSITAPRNTRILTFPESFEAWVWFRSRRCRVGSYLRDFPLDRFRVDGEGVQVGSQPLAVARSQINRQAEVGKTFFDRRIDPTADASRRRGAGRRFARSARIATVAVR